MVRSMTGYGRAERVTDRRRVAVEIKAVNNRYADFNIRMPRRYIFMETRIRQLLKAYIERGKVDVFITAEEYGEGAGSLKYNEALAGEYVRAMRQNGVVIMVERALTDLPRDGRPLSSSQQALFDMWKVREPKYRAAADTTVDNNGKHADAVQAAKEAYYEAAHR